MAAVNRSFRFVPKKEIRESLDFVLKAVALKFEGRIAQHEYQFLSGHYHLLGTDLEGCLPDSMSELNALASRQLNAIRGIRGTNIEKDYNLVIVDMHTGDRAFEHAVYALANAVRAHLVERTSEWKGPSSWELEYGEVYEAARPKIGLWTGKQSHAKRRASQRSKRAKYAGPSKIVEVARFKLVRPPIHRSLSDRTLRARIRAAVEKIENDLIKKRNRNGRRVEGWNSVVRRSFTEIPPKGEEYFGVRPTFSAENQERRRAAAERRKTFLSEYAHALGRYIAGVKNVVFPFGTWLMRRRFKAKWPPGAVAACYTPAPCASTTPHVLHALLPPKKPSWCFSTANRVPGRPRPRVDTTAGWGVRCRRAALPC